MRIGLYLVMFSCCLVDNGPAFACPEPAPSKQSDKKVVPHYSSPAWIGDAHIRTIVLDEPLVDNTQNVHWRVLAGPAVKKVVSSVECEAGCTGERLTAVPGPDGYAHFQAVLAEGLRYSKGLEIVAEPEGGVTQRRYFRGDNRNIAIEKLELKRPMSIDGTSRQIIAKATVGSDSTTLYVDFTLRTSHADKLKEFGGDKERAVMASKNIVTFRVYAREDATAYEHAFVAEPVDNFRYYQLEAVAVNVSGGRSKETYGNFEESVYEETPLALAISPVKIRVAVGEAVPLIVFGEFPSNGLYPIWADDPLLKIVPGSAEEILCILPGVVIGNSLGKTTLEINYRELRQRVDVEVVPLLDRIAAEKKAFGREEVAR